MRLRCLSLFTLVCSQSVATVVAPARAGEPSVSDLIGLAPVIRSSDEKYQSIEVTGYIKDDGFAKLRFRAIHRAPDRYALSVSDGADGTPLFIASGNNMLVYDPIRPAVLYTADNRTDFSIWQEESGVKVASGFHRKEGKPSSILLDVRSMFRGPSKCDELVKIGEGEYRLTRTTLMGNFLVSHIDTSRKCPRGRLVSHGDRPFVHHAKVTQPVIKLEDRIGGAAPWTTSLASAA